MSASIYGQFCKQLGALLDTPLPGVIAVAVSGGSDSMALLHLAYCFAQEHKISLLAVTVEHGLRSESTQEAMAINQFLEKQNIKHYILVWEHGPITSNIQAQARSARYKLLSEFCHSHNCKHLLLGHHQDDQLEHYFLRKERSSGIIGMAPISATRKINNLTLVRPLLTFPKSQLLCYLEVQGWPFWEDPSNQNADYRRNFWRIKAAQLSKEERLNILKELSLYEKQAQWLNKKISDAFQKLVTITPLGSARLEWDQWSALDKEIKWRLTIEVAIRISGVLDKWKGSEVTRLVEKFSSLEAKPTTFHGLVWEIAFGQVFCCREPAAVPKTNYAIAPYESLYFDGRWYIENNTSRILYVSSGEIKTLAQFIKLVPELNSYAKMHKVRARELLTLPLLRLENFYYLPHISNMPAGIVVEFSPLRGWQ